MHPSVTIYINKATNSRVYYAFSILITEESWHTSAFYSVIILMWLSLLFICSAIKDLYGRFHLMFVALLFEINHKNQLKKYKQRHVGMVYGKFMYKITEYNYYVLYFLQVNYKPIKKWMLLLKTR